MFLPIYAIIASFFITIIICPFIIPFLTKLKFGQFVRDDGPESHLRKSGTPTMGGIIFMISFIVTVAFFVAGNTDGMVVSLVTLGFGLIGFLDDYVKVVKKRSLGLRAYQKLVLQLIVCCLFAYYLLAVKKIGTDVYIPFTDGYLFDLEYFYVPFLLVVVLGTVNGVNLTDGLDGLAAGVTALVALFFGIMSHILLNDASSVSGAIVGSLMGFLLYNAHPARVFMGDTGSLALGGYVSAISFILKMPVFIVIVGIIYLVEALSVMIQVGYFKKTKKRIFKMAPIHHHLELSGWPETRIVALFYLITAIACLIGFIAARGIA